MKFDKETFNKFVNALILTVFAGGAIHLGVIMIAAIVKRQPGLLNPVEILGLNTLWPQLENVANVSTILWTVLVAFYFLIYYWLSHYKQHVGIVSQAITDNYAKAKLRIQELRDEIDRLKNNQKHS